MPIYHSEFEEIFNYLENEIPLPLTEAADRWSKIKDTGLSTMREWIKVLKEKTKDYMGNGYSMETAMIEVWFNSYDGISDDSEKWYFNISDLRDFFFNGSLDELERYEDESINREDRCPCIKCEWFVKNHKINKGYCNNFSIERELDSRCISDTE